ncbi:hypothetical protein YSY43_15880 [Paenibacillus sp. YSY-4.3]
MRAQVRGRDSVELAPFFRLRRFHTIGGGLCDYKSTHFLANYGNISVTLAKGVESWSGKTKQPI